MNLPGAQRIGSVGVPLPGCTARIAPGGEILVQAPGVFSGYWQDPQATSGDVSTAGGSAPGTRPDPRGRFVYLTGRKKDLIITATGQNIVPTVLEDRLREHWLIEEAVITGGSAALHRRSRHPGRRRPRPVETAARRAGHRDRQRPARRPGPALRRPGRRGPGEHGDVQGRKHQAVPHPGRPPSPPARS